MGFEPCDYPNLNTRLYLPVIHGMWKQHELWDGTYTFNDWLDCIELILVKNENESRANDYREQNRGR